MLKKIVVLLISVLFSLPGIAQDFEFGGRYLPAKQELETEIAYNFDEFTAIGAVHNEEKRYFDPKADDFTITYLYFNFELFPGLRIQPSYGTGYRRDLELSMFYEQDWFYFEFGSSETEPFFFKIKLSF